VEYILESIRTFGNHRVTLLAGGVGGARMAQALRHVLDPGHLTVVVNIGDDTKRYGVHVAADPDTVLYTLAGVIGEHGWGRSDDTFKTMEALETLGVDTAFVLGDKDLALCILRTEMMESGMPLSEVLAQLSTRLGLVDVVVMPASDNPVRTHLQIASGQWLDFQTYFVDRSHADTVTAVAYHGATEASAAPGVLDAIASADTLVIAPSNPPLSVWPILAIDDIAEAVSKHSNRCGVSPLFSGTALKGPAAEVMAGVGLSAGTRGILEAYHGHIDDLFIDQADSGDIPIGDDFGIAVHTLDTRLTGQDHGATFASEMLGIMTR